MHLLRSSSKLITRLSVPIVVAIIVAGCATIVTPSGGPKDETPPEMLKSVPENRSINFHGDRLTLYFSEFIDLKNIEKELMISPPLGKDPDIKIKGKSLVVKIHDTLRDNTTYNFFLGNSIVDITELNPLPNFNFAFSTGPVIDSMSLAGRVADAFTLLPVKEVYVMLYTDFTDSIPKTQRPVYVSRTNASGDFLFNNIAFKPYRVIALQDANNDFMYNMPNEQVAFSSDTIYPDYVKTKEADTARDSEMSSMERTLQLLMFPEPDSVQRLSKSLVPAENRVTLIFRYPVRNFSIQPLDTALPARWNLMETSKQQDTLNLWLLPPVPDTLKIVVSADEKVRDTLTLSTKAKQKALGRGAKESSKNTLLIRNNLESGRRLPWNTPLILVADNPVTWVHDSLPRLIRITRKDTIQVPLVALDSLHRRRFKVKAEFPTGEEFSLIIPKHTFTDIYQNTNDSITFSFKPNSKDELGSLKIRLSSKNAGIPFIVQLLGEKDAILAQRFIHTGESADFGYLSPGKYRIRAIFDQNSNRKWDTGIFLKKIQPEKVSMYPKTLEIRANWDLEEDWVL